jgi:hypothetical protein
MTLGEMVCLVLLGAAAVAWLVCRKHGEQDSPPDHGCGCGDEECPNAGPPSFVLPKSTGSEELLAEELRQLGAEESALRQGEDLREKLKSDTDLVATWAEENSGPNIRPRSASR